MRFEVVVIPVGCDRAKEYYSLGWRLDADFGFDNGSGSFLHTAGFVRSSAAMSTA